MEQDFEKPKPEENGIIKCAWCEKVLGSSEKINGVSHGVCEECDEKVFGDIRRKRAEEEKNKKENI